MLVTPQPAVLRPGTEGRSCLTRRRSLLAAPLLLVALPSPLSAAADPGPASGLTVVSESTGFGKHEVQAGDLVLAHWVGRLESGGTVFDTTRGGVPVRTNGESFSITPAPSVPRAVLLRSGDVQPGVVAGLRLALLGMRVGGKRTVSFGPELGFGQVPVAAPVASVPGGSSLQYEIELLRVSTTGPDALFQGIAQCGIGGAGAQSAGCADIVAAE